MLSLTHLLLVNTFNFFSCSHLSFHSGVFVSVKNELRNLTIEILDSRICAIRPEYWEPMLYYMAVTTFLVFLIPIIVITVLYVLMGVTLYKASHRPLNNNNNNATMHEHIVIHHHGQQQFWLRQNTASIIKSRPMRNSRRAVLKMLGKKRKLLLIEYFI